MKSKKLKLSDGNLKTMFRELEEAAPSFDLSKKITRRLLWDKFRFSFALHLSAFVVLLAALPLSYRSVAGDFVKFEIVPMLDSILSNFEFSFDFITYQINFISSFLPVTSLFIFSFNFAVFVGVAFVVLRDFRKFGSFGRGTMQAALGVFLIFMVLASGFAYSPVFAQASESEIEEIKDSEKAEPAIPLSEDGDSNFDKTEPISPLFEKDAQNSPIVFTGIVSEVNGDMAQLIIELRTTNKKELSDLRGSKIVIYTDDETEFVKRDVEEVGLADLSEGDRVTIIGALDESIFWAKKIVAATPWWKKLFK